MRSASQRRTLTRTLCHAAPRPRYMRLRSLVPHVGALRLLELHPPLVRETIHALTVRLLALSNCLCLGVSSRGCYCGIQEQDGSSEGIVVRALRAPRRTWP